MNFYELNWPTAKAGWAKDRMIYNKIGNIGGQFS